MKPVYKTHLSLLMTVLLVFALLMNTFPAAAQSFGQWWGNRLVQPVASDARQYPELDAQIATGETLNLIVGLNLPHLFTPEGYINSYQVKRQRDDIKRVQKMLLDYLGEDAEAYVLYDLIPFVALRVNAAAWQRLKATAMVASIEEDALVPNTLESSVPIGGAPNVWAEGVEGTGWAVAVLDSGVQWDHEFLGGAAHSRVISEACFSNANGGGRGVSLCPDGSNIQTTGHAADPDVLGCSATGLALDGGTLCTHGTHVAGIAAGNHLYASVAYDGVARSANIIGIQVFTRFNNDGDCGGVAPCVLSYISDQVRGLERVLELRSTYGLNIAAVNMSLGGGAYTDAQQALCDTNNASRRTAIQNLRSVGIATIIAAGNNGYVSQISAPGCISEAIAVGASTDSDGIASFSNMNNLVELMAPGVAIVSSVNNAAGNGYASMQGTSMATPYVAGVWTLMRALAPSASVDDILAALQDTGVPIADTRSGGYATKPRVQVDRAGGVLNVATWLGNSTAWNAAANWSTGAVPGRFNSVLIPTAPVGGNFPSLDVNAAISGLTLQDGAQLNVHNPFLLTIFGDWSQGSGSVFNATAGTVRFAGNWDQTLTMSGETNDHFFNLDIGDGSAETALTPGSDLDVNGALTIAAHAALIGSNRTINVAGDWSDAGTTFIPQTSTVVFDGDDQSVERLNTIRTVMTQNFADYDGLASGNFTSSPPAGWSRNPATTNGWYFGRNAPWEVDAAFAMRWWNGSSTVIDSWLFSAGLPLEAGKVYTLQFQYRTSLDFDDQDLLISLGSAAAPASMTQSIWSVLGATNTTWSAVSQNFQVAADGTYYLGFRNQDNDNAYYGILLDNISLSVTENLEFYNLTIASTTQASFANPTWVKNALVVSPGGVMNLNDHPLAVDNALTNNGTLRQSLPVNDASVEFLHIQNSAASITQYRGVMVDSSATDQNLGATTVSVRELNSGEYCTTTEGSSPDYAGRCFAITPVTQPESGQPVLVRLYARTSDELNGIAASNLAVYRHQGPGLGWVALNNRAVGSVGVYSYAQGDTEHFSAFLVAETGAGNEPTAVQLRTIQGRSALNAALLAVLLVALATGGLYLRRRTR